MVTPNVKEACQLTLMLTHMAQGRKFLKSLAETNASMEREVVDTELQKVREVIFEMRRAKEKQKSITMGVKNGLMHLESSLNVIHSMRKLWIF